MSEIEQILIDWKQHRPTWNYALHQNYIVLTGSDEKRYKTLDFMERSGVYWLIPQIKDTEDIKPIVVASRQNIGLVVPQKEQVRVYKAKILQCYPDCKVKRVGNILAIEGINPKQALSNIEQIFVQE